MRRFIAVFALAGLATAWPAATGLDAGTADIVRFAVIGDNGTGKPPQYEVGARLAAARDSFPFEFVIMLGDNLYGGQAPSDLVDKFERPYAPLLQAGVPFYAALGNHDQPTNRDYPLFNMGGERYYTFVKGPVRFVVFDTNLMDRAQLDWIEATLQAAHEPWKVVYFHHPLYSDGDRHGSALELRAMLEPLLVRYGVNVVFSGHDHIYQRINPQHGITYFVAGSSGQLRKGGVSPTAMSAAAFAEDQTFVLVEIAGDRLTFQAITRDGRIVDNGQLTRAPERPRSPS
jgi:predicted MPP superfamily phosphohydrolase